MKDIIEKIDSLMKLLLLGTLLLAWVVFCPEPDPVEIGFKLYQKAKSVPDWQRTSGIRSFIVKVEAQLSTDYRERISELSVRHALAMESGLVLLSLPQIDGDEQRQRTNLALMMRAAIVTNFTQLEKEFEFLRRAMFTKDPYGLTELLRTLRDLLARSGLAEDSTIGALKDKLEPQVQVPIVELQIAIRSASRVLSASIMILLLYLLSFFSAVERRLEHFSESEGIEWIFFHPSWLGIVLGLGWITAPAVVLLIGGISTESARWPFFAFAALIGAVSTVLGRRALALRKSFLRQLRRNEQETKGSKL